MGRVIVALILCSLGAVLLAGFRHYHNSYAPRLRAGEGWLHLQPWEYGRTFGPDAGAFRDHVYLSWKPGVDAAVLTKTDLPLAPVPTELFRQAYHREMEDAFPGATFADCPTVRTDAAIWSCMIFRGDVEGVESEQRAYFARRGNSNILVLFNAAPAESFGHFGDTRQWLARLEWSGPGIAYAF